MEGQGLRSQKRSGIFINKVIYGSCSSYDKKYMKQVNFMVSVKS